LKGSYGCLCVWKVGRGGLADYERGRRDLRLKREIDFEACGDDGKSRLREDGRCSLIRGEAGDL